MQNSMRYLDNDINLNTQKKVFKKRCFNIIIAVMLLALLLLARLFFLQIIENSKFSTLSKRNQLTILPLDASRGLIFDRNGKILAENSVIYDIQLIPQLTKNISQTLQKLLDHNFISKEDIEIFNKTLYQHKHFEKISVRADINENIAARLAAQMFQFPGVSIGAKLIRQYPYGEYSAHIVGYTGLISQNELNSKDGNYLAHYYIGKSGIEKYYESFLHGKIGYEQVEVDAKGRIVQTKESQQPIRGKNLYLSIDIDLQKKVYDIMKDYKGAAILIDTKTGEILAMVSTPSYDPNHLITNNTKKLKKIFSSSNNPMYNRAINGLYPLASPVKPFLALQGLEKKKISETYQIYDPGWYKLPNSKHIFRDVTYHLGGNGWVNLHKSLVRSSDTYYYHLASMLGIKDMHDILTSFGFGRYTDIDIYSESKGLVPTKSWKLENKSEPWYKGDSLLIGIGQGFMQVTPIQIAKATMLLANKGTGFTPHMLIKDVDHLGNTNPTPLKPLRKIKLSKANYWKLVHDGMKGVIYEKGGTGWRFGKDASYTVAGKTGTGQIISLHHNENIDKDNIPDHLKDHSSFIAFAPFTNPEIALAVLIENTPGSSSIAREILDVYFSQKSTFSTNNAT